MGLVKFAVKCAVGGGFLYGIASLDVFGSQERSITSLRELSKSARPFPIEATSGLNVRQKWNSMVKTTFSSIEAAPTKISDLSISGYEKTKGYIIGK